MVLAPLGIPIFFGARFGESIRAANLLAIAGGVAGLNMLLSEGIRGLGRPVSVLRAELAALVVTAVGLWLLLGPLGIYGAALVSLIAYAVTTCWLLVEARLATGVSIADFLCPRRADLYLLTDATHEFIISGLCTVRSVPAALARILRSEGV
jgi:O-antigen/teichoic acid export membrane protein